MFLTKLRGNLGGAYGLPWSRVIRHRPTRWAYCDSILSFNFEESLHPPILDSLPPSLSPAVDTQVTGGVVPTSCLWLITSGHLSSLPGTPVLKRPQSFFQFAGRDGPHQGTGQADHGRYYPGFQFSTVYLTQGILQKGHARWGHQGISDRSTAWSHLVPRIESGWILWL